MPETDATPELDAEPWPRTAWTDAAWPDAAQRTLADAVAPMFDDPATLARLGPTDAVAVVHRGRLVLERDAAGTTPATTLPSWSMAKSMLHAVAGLLVADGLVTLDDAIDHPAWTSGADAGARPPISIRHALEMRDGLSWHENYTDVGVSDVQEMLWGSGRADMAAYVAQRPVAHPPGTVYLYSSGTSNLLSWHLGQVLTGTGDTMATYLRRRLFEPLGITSAIPKFDAAGTWIASSYCFATAQDFLRFGLLYLRDGVVDGRRLLPAGWVQSARTPQPGVDDEGWGYARHWWTLPTRPGAFFANGHGGQFVFLVPEHDLIVFRSGTTPAGASPLLVEQLTVVIDAAVSAAPPAAG